MGNSWGIGRRKQAKIPPPSKFDRLSPEDLYTATETGVANAIAALEAFRNDPSDESDAHLQLALTHLDTATLALSSMIRKRSVPQMLQ